MALNGIDAQIIAQRAVDVAKSASNINKRNELMQDYMALQRKTEDELHDSMVQKLERKDDPQISREHKGAGQNAPNEQNEHNRQSRTADVSHEEEEAPSLGGGSTIDIKI